MEENAKIFRYRSDGIYSIEAALTGKMFFVCPLELNDPFEFYIKYDVDKVYTLICEDNNAKRIVSKMLYEHAITFGDIGGCVSKARSLDECIQMFEDPSRLEQTKHWLKNYIEKRIIQFKESFGIVSLTTKPKEPVMWSHYCNDSRGFLEIYDAKLLISNFAAYINYLSQEYSKHQIAALGIHKIQYVKEFKERNEFVVKLLCFQDDGNCNIGVEMISDKDIAEEVLDIAISKLIAWDYEEEIRFILPCDIYNVKRKKTIDGRIIHDHFFECPLSTPNKIVLGHKANIELEYSLKYYCEKEKIAFEKSNERFDFKII